MCVCPLLTKSNLFIALRLRAILKHSTFFSLVAGAGVVAVFVVHIALSFNAIRYLSGWLVCVRVSLQTSNNEQHTKMNTTTEL